MRRAGPLFAVMALLAVIAAVYTLRVSTELSPRDAPPPGPTTDAHVPHAEPVPSEPSSAAHPVPERITPRPKPPKTAENTQSGSTASNAPAASTLSHLPPLSDEVVQSAWPPTADGLKGAISESGPRMKACYETTLRDVPDLAGQLQIGFTVAEYDGIGRVTTLEVLGGDFEDGPLEDCLLDVFGSLAFDAPAKPLDVTYPIAFAQ